MSTGTIPAWRPATLTGRVATLKGVEYHQIDDGRALYWTVWASGRLIPDKDFEARRARPSAPKRARRAVNLFTQARKGKRQ